MADNLALATALATPTYGQNNPALLQQQRQIQQQQLLAQSLLNQGKQPDTTQVIDGVAVKQSPLAAFARALTQAAGGYEAGKANDASNHLATQAYNAQAAQYGATPMADGSSSPSALGDALSPPTMTVAQTDVPASQVGQESTVTDPQNLMSAQPPSAQPTPQISNSPSPAPTNSTPFKLDGFTGDQSMQLANNNQPAYAALFENQHHQTDQMLNNKSLGKTPQMQLAEDAAGQARGLSMMGGQPMQAPNGQYSVAPISGFTDAQAARTKANTILSGQTVTNPDGSIRTGVPILGQDIQPLGGQNGAIHPSAFATALSNPAPPVDANAPITSLDGVLDNKQVQPAQNVVDATGEDETPMVGGRPLNGSPYLPPMPSPNATPAAPSIGVNPTASAAADSAGKAAGQLPQQINTDAEQALANKRSLLQMQQDQTNFKGGKFADGQQFIAQMKVAAGTATPEDIKAAGAREGFDKLAIQLAGQNAAGLTGTEQQLKTFTSANPNALMTPAGRQDMINYMLKSNELPIQKQKYFQDWRKGKSQGDYGDFPAAWNQNLNKNISGTLLNNAKPAGAPTITNPATGHTMTLVNGAWQ